VKNIFATSAEIHGKGRESSPGGFSLLVEVMGDPKLVKVDRDYLREYESLLR
jgi:hypothetical protein